MRHFVLEHKRSNLSWALSCLGFGLAECAGHWDHSCPGCAVSGFDQTKPALLYYLAVLTDNSETLYKIGITNLSVQKRFPNIDLARIRVIQTWSYERGAEAAKREVEILQEFSDDLYTGIDVLIGAGNTELFVRDVLDLDSEKELQVFKQWKQNNLI